MKKQIHDIWYSFPVQLCILHFRNNHILIFLWIAVCLLVTGKLFKIFGIQYLFTDPEYMGTVSPLSFAFVGMAFGVFIMVWQLSAYLLNAFRFPFLASLSRPFSKFLVNNFIVPFTGIIVMGAAIFYIQSGIESKPWQEVAGLLIGWITGLFFTIGLISSYLFLTNKDYRAYKHHLSTELKDLPQVKFHKFKTTVWHVETYLSEAMQPRLVRNVEHYPAFILQKVYRQNHYNALILLTSGVFILIGLGFLSNYEYFRIPAGASILLLFSVIVSVTSAITFWFKRWRLPVFILLLFLINSATRNQYFRHASFASGLSYINGNVEYSLSAIKKTRDSILFEKDKSETRLILENWKGHQRGNDKPVAVFICSSGGGQRAGIWATQVLDNIDKELNGQLMKKTILMSGASGGVLGMAFYRSLMNEKISIDNRTKALNAFSQDMLNSLSFAVVSNDIFPNPSSYTYRHKLYVKDRGYAFEQQFNGNTKGILDLPISGFREPEMRADIPLLFITPTIINDGRRLLISPQNISYMTTPPLANKDSLDNIIDGIEFKRFFSELKSDSLRFLSALRMNCTYPYILPNVALPTKPSMEIMDAGFRDNSGISVAYRFICNMKEWLKDNTSGIVIIQISAVESEADQNEVTSKGLIEGLFSPLAFTKTILTLQKYEQANYIQVLEKDFGIDKVKVIPFIYQPHPNNQRASMSFHLTQREKEDIRKSIELRENRESLNKLLNVLK